MVPIQDSELMIVGDGPALVISHVCKHLHQEAPIRCWVTA